MKTRFEPNDVARQLLEVVTSDENGRPHHIISENGVTYIGVVKSFSNHVKGRIKLHMYSGHTVSWRMPQHVIDAVADIVTIDGNNGIQAPEGWDRV